MGQEEREEKAFEVAAPNQLDTNTCKDIVRKICEDVEPRTCGQGTAEWFVDRQLSMTSFQAAFNIKRAAVRVGPTDPIRGAFERVLTYSRMKQLLPDDDPPAPATQQPLPNDLPDPPAHPLPDDNPALAAQPPAPVAQPLPANDPDPASTQPSAPLAQPHLNNNPALAAQPPAPAAQPPATNENENNVTVQDPLAQTRNNEGTDEEQSLDCIDGDDNAVAADWVRRITQWSDDSPWKQRFCERKLGRDARNESLPVTNSVIKAMLELLGITVVQGVAGNKTKIQKWVQATQGMRPFLFAKKAELVGHPNFGLTRCKTTDGVEVIRAALATVNTRILSGDQPEERDGENNDARNQQEPANYVANNQNRPDNDLYPMMLTILQRSFLKKEAARDKNDARLVGQRNESVLIKKLMSHSTSWSLPIAAEAIVTTGLIRQKGRKFFKASPDAILAYKQDAAADHEIGVLPVELKTLVSQEKIQKFESQCMRNVGLNAFDRTETYFQSVNADVLYKWLPDNDWLLQAIHQAAVMKKKESVFVVGTERKIKLGLHVKFPDDLIVAYEKIVDWIYSSCLCEFYNPEGLSAETLDKVDACLRSKKMARAKMDMHSFETNYSIWFCLNVESPEGIKFPLPKVSRIIPYVNSNWLGLRVGGSSCHISP